jgi:hypothetical protein
VRDRDTSYGLGFCDRLKASNPNGDVDSGAGWRRADSSIASRLLDSRLQVHDSRIYVLNGLVAMTARNLGGRQLSLGLLALPKRVMHIGMELSGFGVYIPGLRDCGYGPAVQRNRGLYLTRGQFDLLNRLGSMTGKLAAGVIEHVVRAPEQHCFRPRRGKTTKDSTYDLTGIGGQTS